MPKLTIANQDYESFAEKITIPSIILTEISSSNSELESYYIPLFDGNYSDGSVVQLGDYNYTLGKLKVGDLRAALSREGIVTDIGIISSVLSSDNATWVLTIDGELYGCGYNEFGQQGSGDTKNVLTFTKRAENVKEFKCSKYTTWYLTYDNELYGCGKNWQGQQGSGELEDILVFTKRAENVKEFRCTDLTTWYLTYDNELYGCGDGYNGKQGSGKTKSVLTFTKRAENVKEFSCSDQVTWYIDNNNDLYGCGGGGVPGSMYGLQGSGGTADVLTFTKRAENVKEVICSNQTTWYIDNNNDLYGCGYNYYGQQGSGESGNKTSVLTFTKRAENVKKVICTGNTTWYIDNNNDLYGCGCNEDGQQGSGDTTNILTFTKRVENVKEVRCSGFATWYIDNNNNLYACGYNYYGQQGSGDTNSVLTFTKRVENVKEVNCSQMTIWYIDNNNDLYGCGDNEYGQQGSGDTNSVLTFTKRDIIK